MAETSLPTNARVIRWQRDFYREYIRANRFSPMMGADESASIQINEDLARNIGEQINFTLVNRATGSGVTGTSTLEGNEEQLGIRNYRAKVDRTRHAILHDRLHEQFSAFDLVEAKRAVLMDWYKEKIRDRIVQSLLSINVGTGLDSSSEQVYSLASAGDKNTWNANNSDRVLYGNSLSNYNATHATALGNVDSTNDILNTTVLRLAKDVAKTANPKIRPIKVKERNDEEWYVLFCGTQAFRQAQDALATINQNAWERAKGESNPLFVGGDLIYDGLIIKEVPEIVSIGTVGASSANVLPSFLCGTQAVGYSIATRSRMIENVRDYGAKQGAGVEMIDNISKLYFGSGATDTVTPKQNGVVTIFTAY
jgi:hypothetical protein